ncbi:hypothetical protein GGQ92_001190 [Gracilibacillus halotolerans]|uniref:Uncharacterized protein n=1 Tax=Gracilibacillus halotolerans TaxID=74386 RepID=A0A841RKL0_9BACI|nr:hypothetical protein [Gracilibacillus halotolerans]MBB6512407.1 hypothetical protein [Gracilibacillus halotolerans]
MKNTKLIFGIVSICFLSFVLLFIIFGSYFEKDDVVIQGENWRDTAIFNVLSEKSEEYGFGDYGLNSFDDTYKKEVIIVIDHEIDEENLKEELTNKIEDFNQYYVLNILPRELPEE